MPPPGSVDGAAPAGRLAALVSRFTSRTLPKAEWTHEAHLLVGLWHVHRYGEAEALARLREGIRRLNDAHGTPNTPSSGYHETITRAYVTLLADFLASGPAGRTIETRAGELLASPLAARDALLRYYSRERLFSPEARLGWLEPDAAHTVAWRSPMALAFPRVVSSTDGDTLGAPGVVRDRFVLSRATDGAFSLVEHLMPPRALAAPVHRHSREDEYSFVLEGRVGAWFDGVEVVGDAGDLIYKPRGEWHTFWNAGDTPARILEIIAPGGFEQAFREMHALGEALDPESMAAIAARYGVEADFERTMPIIERHGLSF